MSKDPGFWCNFVPAYSHVCLYRSIHSSGEIHSIDQAETTQ